MKQTTKKKADSPEMRSEYDFSGMKGERGKYFKAYREGHEVRVIKDDGSVEVRHFAAQDGTIKLAPDVRPYFPDSDAVNAALRSLIALIPPAPAAPAPRRTSSKK